MAALRRYLPGRRLTRVALLALGWCVLTGGVFSGCRGLFTPAIPEPPQGEVVRPNYTSPEATLLTMELAIGAKVLGRDAWLGAFADSIGRGHVPGYHHSFDRSDVVVFESAGRQAPSDWGRSEEQHFYGSFMEVREADHYTAEFSPADTEDPLPTDSTAVLYRRYRVRATDPQGSSNTLTIAIGLADLTFKKFAGRWLIIRWDDRISDLAAPDDPWQLTLGRRRLESTTR